MRPDLYPGEDRYQSLLDSLLEEGMSDDGWHGPAGDCPTLKRVLLMPREEQMQFLLALLVRLLWQFECRGRAAVARLFLLFGAAKLVLARKLPFTDDDLEALVILTANPNVAKELGSLVVRQVEWHGEPGEPVRRALKRLKRVGRFNRSIEPLLRREVHLPPVSSPAKEREVRALVAHARRLPDRVTRRWFRKGVALLKQLGRSETESHLVSWISEQLKRLHRQHPRLLRGLVVLLGGVRSGAVADLLEEVIKWGYRRRQGYGPQDFRLARSGIRALGRMGTPLAIAYLVILGSELRYHSATEELLRALRRVADKKGWSLHTLVEVKTAAWKPESEIGKRLWRSHTRRLERCMRTGRTWPLEEWRESYQDSPLLGAMGKQLIWRDDKASFRWDRGAWRDSRGRAAHPDGEIRLWHPAEGGWEHWSVRPSPFPQVDREVFQEIEFESCLLRQYQFASLLRERDWYYRLVGRYREQTEAVLVMKGYRAWLRVERAAPVGPFSKEGASIQVRALSMGCEPPLEQFPPRLRSEVIRDIRLFQTVGGIYPLKFPAPGVR